MGDEPRQRGSGGAVARRIAGKKCARRVEKWAAFGGGGRFFEGGLRVCSVLLGLGRHRRLTQGVESFQVVGQADEVPFAVDFL